MVKVYRYRVYDITLDDYRYSTRMATKGHIDRIGGERIEDSEAEIDEHHLTGGWSPTEGWTGKEFDPAKTGE